MGLKRVGHDLATEKQQAEEYYDWRKIMVYEKKYKELVFLENKVRLKDGERWSFRGENVDQIKDG